MSLSFRPLMSVAIIIVIIAACAFFSWWSARRHRPFRTSDLVRRGAITCALLSILIGPSVPGEAQKVTTNVEVWLAIDRTGSMAAEDWEGGKTRLQGVSHDVEQILQAAPGARYRIITWDSEADTELPLTSDLGAVRSFVSTLTQEVSSSSRGSSPDRPAQYIAEEMQDAANKHPENTRVLFVFTDGETSNNSAWRSRTTARNPNTSRIFPSLETPMQFRRLTSRSSARSLKNLVSIWFAHPMIPPLAPQLHPRFTMLEILPTQTIRSKLRAMCCGHRLLF